MGALFNQGIWGCLFWSGFGGYVLEDTLYTSTNTELGYVVLVGRVCTVYSSLWKLCWVGFDGFFGSRLHRVVGGCCFAAIGLRLGTLLLCLLSYRVGRILGLFPYLTLLHNPMACAYLAFPPLRFITWRTSRIFLEYSLLSFQLFYRLLPPNTKSSQYPIKSYIVVYLIF